jgi:pantetheine-phosphate adenylyltransferase
VRKFLTLIARNLELDLVPIQDVYGPTAYDPEISGLVISEETRAGAQSIAELRKEKGLQMLDVFVIDVIGDAGGTVGVAKMAEEKMSSTKIRERLARNSKYQK